MRFDGSNNFFNLFEFLHVEEKRWEGMAESDKTNKPILENNVFKLVKFIVSLHFFRFLEFQSKLQTTLPSSDAKIPFSNMLMEKK